jgi:replicative DNA helicase
MPVVPPSIQLPNTDRLRPWTLGESVQRFDDRMKAGSLDLYRPIPLGLPGIDACLGGGVHAEDMVLLGGMQNIGKTIVSMQAAFSIAAGGHALPIVICYEHGLDTLLQRLICAASVDDPNSSLPTGVTRAEIETTVLTYYDQANTNEARHELDMDWILRRLPAAERAWWRLRGCLDRLWLVHGDSVETTLEYLARYVETARHYGFRRVVLIVDYAQRVPLSPALMRLGLVESQRIDLIMRGLKSLAMNHGITVLAVTAADAEGLRRQRIHVENLWGPATVQYEPDVAIILNRDTLDRVDGERWVRVAIEKNRHGPSEVEFRHRLHGAFYHMSPHGEPVTDEESYQSDRSPRRNAHAADPSQWSRTMPGMGPRDDEIGALGC